MRVAVIGGGIAGLGCAWSLQGAHEVTLFEREPRLGGHAYTVDVDSPKGQVPVDMGFVVFNEWLYPNLAALLRRLNIDSAPTPPQRVSVVFEGGAWCTDHSTPFGDAVAHEADRLQLAMPNIVADPLRFAETTLGDYLQQEGYSQDFIHKVVVPASSDRFVAPRGILDVSLIDFAAGFGPVALYSLVSPTYWRTVVGGARRYVDKLADALKGQIELGAPIERVTRDHNEVRIERAGQSERFDQVVLATPADVALELLDDPSEAERTLLGDTAYQPTHVVLHDDPGAMPKDRALWTTATYQTDEARVPFTESFMTYHCRQSQRELELDVFTAINPPDGRITPSKIIEEKRWSHGVADALAMLRAGELHRIQGKRRTWFCGEYTGLFNGHEAALVSGLAIAGALGADYPFEDAAARRLHDDIAINHMRVLNAPAPAPLQTWWPPVLGKVNEGLVHAIMKGEVTKELKKRAPMLQRALGMLKPLEAAVATGIAKRISPYEEAKRSEQER